MAQSLFGKAGMYHDRVVPCNVYFLVYVELLLPFLNAKSISPGLEEEVHMHAD